MIWQEAATTSSSSSAALFEGGFSWGTFLLVIGMVVSLAVVSSLGILARMRDRSKGRTATEMTSSITTDSNTNGNTNSNRRSDAPPAG